MAPYHFTRVRNLHEKKKTQSESIIYSRLGAVLSSHARTVGIVYESVNEVYVS